MSVRSSTSRGAVISDDRAERYDFDRLERAMRGLVERYLALQDENRKLGRALAEREGHVRGLDDRLLQMSQRREDAAKRIDDLIAQIDRIDAGLSAHDSEATG